RGGTASFTFQATLDAGLAPGQVLSNTARVRYSTLAGDVTRPQSPYNAVSTERTGDPADPGGAVNDLTASATTSVTVQAASLAGAVYIDANNDGFREQGEPGIGGVTIALDGFDRQGHHVSATTTTTDTGAYLFGGLAAGTYRITAELPPGRIPGKQTVG